MRRRLLSLLVAFAMVMAMIPASALTAFAETGELTFVTQPEDIWCQAGDTVEFTVEADGGTGEYTYEWYYISDEMYGYEAIKDAVWASGTDTGTLTVEVTDELLELCYGFTCMVTDSDGTEMLSETGYLRYDDPGEDDYYNYLNEVYVTYKAAGGEYITEGVWVDESSMGGEITLPPYDTSEPVELSWTAGDGTEEYMDLTFEDGAATAVIEYDSQEYGLLEYTITVYEAAEPLVEVVFFEKDNEVEYEYQIVFDRNNYYEFWLPYGYDPEKPVTVTVTHLNGEITTPSIVWDADGTGKVTFTSMVKGVEEIYTIDIFVDGPSSDTDCFISLTAENENGESKDIIIECDVEKISDGKELATAVVELPYGITEAELWVELWGNDQSIEGYEGYYDWEQGEYVTETVTAGQTKEFTVTAQDGTERVYSIRFIASDGTRTDIEMRAWFFDANRPAYDSDYNEYADIDFESDGDKMTAEVLLPYQFDNSTGIQINYDAYDFVSIDFDPSEILYLDEDGTRTLAFTVTSSNGEVAQDYEINFVKDTDGSKAECKSIIISYMDVNGDYCDITVDQKEASSAEGAVIVLPEDADLYEMVTLDVWSSAYGYIHDIEYGDAQAGDGDFDYLFAGFNLAEYDPSEYGFSIRSANGENVTEYKLTIMSAEAAEDVTYGDANGDGKVNVKDAVLVLQYANKKLAADQLDLTASDVNGDGKVNVKDATMVLQYANKKLDSFPAAK